MHLLIKALHRDPPSQLPRLEPGLPYVAGWVGYCMTQGGTIVIVDIIDTHIYYNSFSADAVKSLVLTKFICYHSFLTDEIVS